jgi:uncharacterized protein YukE
MANPMVMSNGGGSSSLINVNSDEMITIFNYLQEIITELESNVTPNTEKLGQIKYYSEGKAKKAMEVYADANAKVMDLQDNYVRAQTLVIDILNTMMEADAAIAQQIIAKLEL